MMRQLETELRVSSTGRPSRIPQVVVVWFVLVTPFAARADVIWPALIIEVRLLSVWVILLGLAVEWPVIRYLTRQTWWKSPGITIIVNAASTLFGVLLIPLAGILWEAGPGLLMYRVGGVGTFNPVTWTATVIIAALVSASIELLVLRWPFKYPVGRREFVFLSAANLASTAIAAASLVIWPAEY